VAQFTFLSVVSATATVAQGPHFIYVDPVDYERAILLNSCAERGASALQAWSAPYAQMIAARYSLTDDERQRLQEDTAPDHGQEFQWASQRIANVDSICGVLCGSDAGLATAERLQNVLLPDRSNGPNVARRDKFLMNRALASAGLTIARQASVCSWAEASIFLSQLPKPLQVVIKPRRGQSSLRVGLATSMQQSQRMVEMLLDVPASLDQEEVPQRTALVQEFLDGDEWVVDTVSRNGEHKALALWRYSKGPANGAPFVYNYDELMPAVGGREESLVRYVFAALDALHWRWGPAHIELKWTSRGPVLVEVNAGRFNGVDFKQLVDICVGRNMYDATLDAYTNEAAWQALPMLPPAQLHGAGRLVKLISSVEGVLRALQHRSEIERLPSMVRFQPAYTEEGDQVELTLDLASAAGFATLLHSDPGVVDADYRTLKRLQPHLFDVE